MKTLMIEKLLSLIVILSLISGLHCNNDSGATANQPPAVPSSPIPANSATNISTSPTLSWTCTDPEHDTLIYDVYFGMDNPPATKVSSNQNDTSLSCSGLSYSTTYYWKVIAKDNHSLTTIGEVWSFTTGANQPPAVPSSPIPANSATNISTSPTLSWTCSDPEHDTLTYDVYFGMDNPPATKVSTGQGDTTLNRSGLNNNTTYYWKVVVKDNHSHTTTGAIWEFTTRANQPPVAPTSPTPSNNSTNSFTSLTLNWSCSDPENDPLTYDAYFGTDNPPATRVSAEQRDTTLSRSGLSNSTKYYWKVIAKDNHSNSTIGAVWSFTTGQWGSPCPGTPTVTYSGKTYHTAQTGSQCWLKENLDIGTMIDSLTIQSNNNTIEKYCYRNDPANCTTYGGLYQWDEAMQYSTTEGAQGICPAGWHIPTLTEFKTLVTTVNFDGDALKAVGQGTGSGAGTNTSGFFALLSGWRFNGGGFYDLGIRTYYWSSTTCSIGTAVNLYLNYYDSNPLFIANNIWADGFSVRCLKN